MLLGAASAFGLTTLLPLNVPENEPLMYCPNLDLEQAKIQLDGMIYFCIDSFIHVECLQDVTSSSTSAEESSIQNCTSKQFLCDSAEIDDTINCKDGALRSSQPIVCETAKAEEDSKDVSILECYFGELPIRSASFIPTTERPILTTEKTVGENSFIDKIKNFFQNLFAQNTRIVETPELEANAIFSDDETVWTPDALPVVL